MKRKDRRRWRQAETLADLGELVIAWLNGEIHETPSHCGAPYGETIPLIPVLTAVNRAGFITNGSQLAETPSGPVSPDEGFAWNAWVDGFASDDVLARLRDAVAGAPLTLTACRGCVHECGVRRWDWWFCPWKDSADFWDERCPRVRDQLYGCWYVCVSDPRPGRNDVLWPALERLAR
jgi:Domain of unknown function (DUF6919)